MRALLPPGYSYFLADNGYTLGDVSPRRGKIRVEAGRALEVQGKKMQRLAQRRMGRLPVVGDMVQVKIPDVDRGKLDPPCLTTIVVEVSLKQLLAPT